MLSELIASGRGLRILVLVVKSMLSQCEKEFWNRFTIPLIRLDSVSIRRVLSRIPATSMPSLTTKMRSSRSTRRKQEREYRSYLETAYWDIIVNDEVPNVAVRGGGGSLHSRLERLPRPALTP